MIDLIIGIVALVAWIGLWVWGALEEHRVINRILTDETSRGGGR